MAITLLGQPDAFAPGYNPMYFYASSTNATQPNFRYLVDVYKYDPITSVYTTLANLKIKPRFGDDYLEVNIAKILQSNLASFADDAIMADDVVIATWNNTDSSGFIYIVCIGETYLGQWNFTSISNIINPPYLTLVGPIPPYSVGDIITVNGIANVNDYTSITNNAGYAQFNLTTPHTFLNGDLITVQQDAPFDYPIYNGQFAITDDSDPNSLTVNILYQGANLLPQTGTTTRNGFMDGTAIITEIAIDGSDYNVTLNTEVTVNFPDASTGFTTYTDGSLSVFQSGSSGSLVSGTVREELSVFNGVVGHNSFVAFDDSLYTSTTAAKFLTTCPDNWTVKIDNSVFLDFYSINGQGPVNGLTNYLEIKTYDSTNTLLDAHTLFNQTPVLDRTLIQTVAVGPQSLNTTNVIQNGDFVDGSFWLLTDFNGSNTVIANGDLTYLDTAGGNGQGSAVQLNALEIGNSYTVSLTVSNNNFALIQVGDDVNTYPIVLPSANGTYTTTFTAAGNDFWIAIDSAGGVTQGVTIEEITSVIVNDIIDCNVDHYTVQVFKAAYTNVVANGEFTSGASWTITDTDNALTTITGGQLVYEDDVEFGGTGSSTTVQTGILTPGNTYNVVMTVANNSECTVSVGDNSESYVIFNANEEGTHYLSFIPTSGSSFVITINGTSAVTNALEINSVLVYDCAFSAQSELRTFNLDCSCEARFTNYELVFMDRMGSFIPFNFSLNNKQRVGIKREIYNKQIGRLNTISQNYAYSNAESSNRNYSIMLDEQWELNSDWMTEIESVYFEQLLTSPYVFLTTGATSIAVNIVDSSYERVRKQNKKNIMHTVTIAMANNNGIQTG
jgi:hypothetical protein